MVNGYINPRFLELSTRWRRVASFTVVVLYPRYPLSRLGGPQSRCGRYGEVKILELILLGRPSRSQYSITANTQHVACAEVFTVSLVGGSYVCS
jgi:hypothetical protein